MESLVVSLQPRVSEASESNKNPKPERKRRGAKNGSRVVFLVPLRRHQQCSLLVKAERARERSGKRGRRRISLKSNKTDKKRNHQKNKNLSLFVYFFEGYITLKKDAQIHLQGRENKGTERTDARVFREMTERISSER
jgi:hypothetical protein